MSTYQKPLIQAFNAGEVMTGMQFYLVKLGADKDTVVHAQNGDDAIGVLMSLSDKVLLGDRVEVAIGGGAKVKAAGTITRGDHVGPEAGSTGKASTLVSGETLGIAMDDAVAGDIIPILIDRAKL